MVARRPARTRRFFRGAGVVIADDALARRFWTILSCSSDDCVLGSCNFATIAVVVASPLAAFGHRFPLLELAVGSDAPHRAADATFEARIGEARRWCGGEEGTGGRKVGGDSGGATVD